ncbi:hypothetical protein C8R44DRAFT_731154 [Mycena epipterygia]|nr:hypothetical protein C8R44DRAFT_731154 [Mycena epipterygia]
MCVEKIGLAWMAGGSIRTKIPKNESVMKEERKSRMDSSIRLTATTVVPSIHGGCGRDGPAVNQRAPGRVHVEGAVENERVQHKVGGGVGTRMGRQINASPEGYSEECTGGSEDISSGVTTRVGQLWCVGCRALTVPSRNGAEEKVFRFGSDHRLLGSFPPADGSINIVRSSPSPRLHNIRTRAFPRIAISFILSSTSELKQNSNHHGSRRGSHRWAW